MDVGINKVYTQNRQMATKNMWKWLNNTLIEFYNEFSREASFRWFVIVIIGFMVRTDMLGVTSFIRELNLQPKLYESLIHFFHAESWRIAGIKERWMRIVASSSCLIKENGYTILVGDGMNQSKEGKKAPGTKKLHQESENSSKAKYIYGHFYGVIGVMAGKVGQIFCIPISASIQSGVNVIRKWEEPTYENVSHIIQTVLDACYATTIFGQSILLLDRYFLSVPGLQALADYEKQSGKKSLNIVTRAKRTIVAYTKPDNTKKPSRGRPRKKGDKIKLVELFKNTNDFIETSVLWYGEKKKITYLCKDLLWGKGLYQELRFVLVCCGDIQTILVSTDLSLTVEQIIKLYGYRFKIEVTFKTLKQMIKAFYSHFWSKAMPKLNRYSKKEDPDPLEAIEDKATQSILVKTLKAIEGHALFGCIAIGLLQMISLLFSKDINQACFRWLRTKSNEIPSEATTSNFMRKTIFFMFRKSTNFFIIRIILDKQTSFDEIENFLSA